MKKRAGEIKKIQEEEIRSDIYELRNCRFLGLSPEQTDEFTDIKLTSYSNEESIISISCPNISEIKEDLSLNKSKLTQDSSTDASTSSCSKRKSL